MKSVPKLPKNVAPFTIGGWPVDALSPGTIRLLRKIAQEDGWTMEEVMTAAMEEFVMTRKAEEEFKTKIIQFAALLDPPTKSVRVKVWKRYDIATAATE